MSKPRTIRRIALAGLLSLSVVAASCADDEVDTADSTATTAAPSSDSGSSSTEPTGPGCASVPDDGAGSFAGMAEDPAATAASNNPLLSTLVAAVTEAGLVDTLNGPGPFTIFAPSNDAFAKIPEADLNAVLADKATLTKILTLHVVPEQMSADDLISAGMATTVEGQDITFSGDADNIEVNGQAAVVCANVQTANATVFIIDSVLMPDAMSSGSGASTEPSGPACAAVPADGAGSFTGMAEAPAATAASNNPVLSTLVAAVTEAGLVDTLNGPGPFTIFAPSNDAFAKIPEADLNAVLADKATLTKILTLHVVAGKMSAADLAKAGTATTVEGQDITFSGDASSLQVNGQAAVVCGDVQVAKATVHIIDSVLMPS